jgi:hypothetical protein
LHLDMYMPTANDIRFHFLPWLLFLFKFRLPALALEEALAATEAAAPSPRPFPSEERLKAARAFTDAIEADAAKLAQESALSTDAFASLLAHREPASGDSCEGSLSGLVKCQRCNKVMFSSVKAHHATLCKIRQAVAATTGAATGLGATAYGAAPSDSDWQPSNLEHAGSKGRKRKPGQQSYDNTLFPPPPPASKSRFSRDSSHRSGSLPSHQAPPPIEIHTAGDRYHYDSSMQPPLSPMLAAAAGLRQGRSAPSRERRRQLAYLPNQDLDEPLILNRSPVRGGVPGSGGRAAAGGPIPLRLASQNSEELRNRTGSGPPSPSLPIVQQQQQGGAAVLSAQQLDYHLQHHTRASAAGANFGAQQQQQRFIALPPQLTQHFAAQIQYAQQMRQQQQQQAADGGPEAPVLQGGSSTGGGSGNIFINGISGVSTMPAAMYYQFVPSSIGSGFVPVQQHPSSLPQ